MHSNLAKKVVKNFFPMELEVLSDLECEGASPVGITERFHKNINNDLTDIFWQGGGCSHGMASDDRQALWFHCSAAHCVVGI